MGGYDFTLHCNGKALTLVLSANTHICGATTKEVGTRRTTSLEKLMQEGRKVLRKKKKSIKPSSCGAELQTRGKVQTRCETSRASPSHECSIIPAPSACQGRKRPCCFDETSTQGRWVQLEGANLSRSAATRTTPHLLLALFLFFIMMRKISSRQNEMDSCIK